MSELKLTEVVAEAVKNSLPKGWDASIRKNVEKGAAEIVAREMLKSLNRERLLAQLDIQKISHEALRLAVAALEKTLVEQIHAAVEDGLRSRYQDGY